MGFSMGERGFFSASNDIKTLDGNIFSGFTTQLIYDKVHAEIEMYTERNCLTSLGKKTFSVMV